MATISLCMICKNEAELLPGCLENVRHSVDEIVIVDTGSTDGTQQIASDHGARVVEVPWVDFSSARNRSLREATGEWAFVLDADEDLVVEATDRLRQLAESGEADAFALRIINCKEMSEFVDVENSTHFFAIRFFRRQDALYRNPIHEILSLPDSYRSTVAEGVDIVHYGYIQEIKRERGKKPRNAKLLLDWVKNQPDHPQANYYLARDVLLPERKFSEAAARFEKASPGLAAAGLTTIGADVFIHLVECYEEIGLHDRVETTFEEGLLLYPDFVELLYFYGCFLLRQQRPLEAIKQFGHCLKCDEHDPRYYVSEPGLGSWRALELLGKAFLSLGEIDKAVLASELARCISGRDMDGLRAPPSFHLSPVAQAHSANIATSGVGAAQEVIDYLLDSQTKSIKSPKNS